MISIRKLILLTFTLIVFSWSALWFFVSYSVKKHLATAAKSNNISYESVTVNGFPTNINCNIVGLSLLGNPDVKLGKVSTQSSLWNRDLVRLEFEKFSGEVISFDHSSTTIYLRNTGFFDLLGLSKVLTRGRYSYFVESIKSKLTNLSMLSQDGDELLIYEGDTGFDVKIDDDDDKRSVDITLFVTANADQELARELSKAWSGQYDPLLYDKKYLDVVSLPLEISVKLHYEGPNQFNYTKLKSDEAALRLDEVELRIGETRFSVKGDLHLLKKNAIPYTQLLISIVDYKQFLTQLTDVFNMISLTNDLSLMSSESYLYKTIRFFEECNALRDQKDALHPNISVLVTTLFNDFGDPVISIGNKSFVDLIEMIEKKPPIKDA
jgi:hypothetical protein